MSTVQEPGVQETLAWEAQQRPRAAVAAVVGGLLTLIGNVLLALVTSGGPTERDGFVSLTESLGAQAQGREPEGPSLWVGQIEHWGDNVALLTLSTVLTAVAGACAALVLLYLYRAVRARSPETGRGMAIAALAGLVLYPLGHLAREVGQWVGAAGFEDERVRTAETARDVLAAPIVGVGGIVELAGAFGLALAFVLVCLSAMRVGLLSRFLGVLGIIVGALTVFQLDQPGIVRAFWLVMTGLLIAGRAPRFVAPPSGGTVAAWRTGRAEPWPTQQQLREQRQGTAAPAPEPEPRVPSATADADAEQRRKRKRRR